MTTALYLKVETSFEVAGRGVVVTIASEPSELDLGVAHGVVITSPKGVLTRAQAFREFMRLQTGETEVLRLTGVPLEAVPADSTIIFDASTRDWSHAIAYFEGYDEYSQELDLVKRIASADAVGPPSQATLDDFLKEIGHCPEGSMICSLWWTLRIWGVANALSVPKEDSFPW